MAEAVSAMIDGILRRIRDTSANGTARSVVQDVLSGCQKTTPVGTFSQVQSAPMTTNAEQLLYQIDSVAPRAGRILGVQVGPDNEELGFTEWQKLKAIDPGWFRRIGPYFQTWSLIGRDIFIIYPALIVASTVALSYVLSPVTITGEAEINQIPNDEVQLMVMVAEAALRIRSRQLNGVSQMIEGIDAGFKAKKLDIDARYQLRR